MAGDLTSEKPTDDGPNEFPLSKLGRARIAVADWEPGLKRPKLPDGSAAPCEVACPKPGVRKMTRAISSDGKHGNRIVTTCLGTHSEAALDKAGAAGRTTP